jgi:multisubunit Na+/H+ antiporter MnhB subunit
MQRRAARRAITISVVLTGLFTVFSGFWNFFPPYDSEFSPGHAVGASVFGVLALAHAWLNRRPIRQYFRGLGWWWAVVGLGFAALIPLLLVPVLRMT